MCAVLEDGKVRCWGNPGWVSGVNVHGNTPLGGKGLPGNKVVQFNSATHNRFKVPGAPNGANDVVSEATLPAVAHLAGSSDFMCAVMQASYHVRCWAFGGYGIPGKNVLGLDQDTENKLAVWKLSVNNAGSRYGRIGAIVRANAEGESDGGFLGFGAYNFWDGYTLIKEDDTRKYYSCRTPGKPGPYNPYKTKCAIEHCKHLPEQILGEKC